MSIKPVVYVRGKDLEEGLFGSFGKEKLWQDDVPLYAIPDTHRVVPVELLKMALESIPWELRDSEACLAIRAIIEDKPCSQS